jgi:hypothetical protein
VIAWEIRGFLRRLYGLLLDLGILHNPFWYIEKYLIPQIVKVRSEVHQQFATGEKDLIQLMLDALQASENAQASKDHVPYEMSLKVSFLNVQQSVLKCTASKFQGRSTMLKRSAKCHLENSLHFQFTSLSTRRINRHTLCPKKAKKLRDKSNATASRPTDGSRAVCSRRFRRQSASGAGACNNCMNMDAFVARQMHAALHVHILFPVIRQVK